MFVAGFLIIGAATITWTPPATAHAMGAIFIAPSIMTGQHATAGRSHDVKAAQAPVKPQQPDMALPSARAALKGTEVSEAPLH
jgi:hypothetical protein